MLSIVYRKCGLTIQAVWFCSDPRQVLTQNRSDIIFFHGIGEPDFKAVVSCRQHTLLTDLTAPAAEIFQSFGKHCRSKINKAQKEGILCRVFTSEDLQTDQTVLAAFKQEYAEFTRVKGIRNCYNEGAMKAYMEQGNLLLTKAVCEGRDCAQHIYIVQGRQARILYSVSCFREGGCDPDRIARANRYLHWTDMQYLQHQAVQTLDWGGVSSVTNPTGVDKFKLEFGGREETYHNVMVSRSLLGQLAVRLNGSRWGGYVLNKIGRCF